MTLTDKEKIYILISQAITFYSNRMREGNIPKNQSVIDFVLKAMPEQYRSKLSMDLIDDVMAFISSNNMELS
ncbi:MAG: hypothetical protein KGI33_02805 [Thaumarchaeota archaeon]|nr:hypothetical protein [Nitrososphaerota archaeon]